MAPSIDFGQFWLAVVLQVPLLVAFGYMIARGIFVAGRELDRREKEHQAELQRRTETLQTQIEYRETLRTEERDARLRAEERLSTMAKGIEQITGLMTDIEKEIIRGGRTRK